LLSWVLHRNDRTQLLLLLRFKKRSWLQGEQQQWQQWWQQQWQQQWQQRWQQQWQQRWQQQWQQRWPACNTLLPPYLWDVHIILLEGPLAHHLLVFHICMEQLGVGPWAEHVHTALTIGQQHL
jgi:hypothetical protein